MKELLEQMKEYIEDCEETISMSNSWAYLTAEELIEAGDMPQIYDDVLSELLKF